MAPDWWSVNLEKEREREWRGGEGRGGEGRGEGRGGKEWFLAFSVLPTISATVVWSKIFYKVPWALT